MGGVEGTYARLLCRGGRCSLLDHGSYLVREVLRFCHPNTTRSQLPSTWNSLISFFNPGLWWLTLPYAWTRGNTVEMLSFLSFLILFPSSPSILPLCIHTYPLISGVQHVSTARISLTTPNTSPLVPVIHYHGAEGYRISHYVTSNHPEYSPTSTRGSNRTSQDVTIY